MSRGISRSCTVVEEEHENVGYKYPVIGIVTVVPALGYKGEASQVDIR